MSNEQAALPTSINEAAAKKKGGHSPFRKAKAEQAFIKLGMYGPSGSGKTFTALLIAEGLAKLTGKRVAFVDTERGTDFYCQAVKSRKVHPEAFDFDALYSRSITDVIAGVNSLDPDEYSVIIIDSITHLWEAAKLAYSGKITSIGTIPFHAWGKIKKPYKDMINTLLSTPMHVIFCGRQGNEFEDDAETGELKKVGVKMKAEGETPYEPHILIRLEAVRNSKSNTVIIQAYIEKDRTSVLSLQTIDWPNFDNIAKPLIPLLGNVQAVIESDEDTSLKDAEVLSEQEIAKIKGSEKLLGEFQARFTLCKTLDALKEIGAEITPELKKKLTSADVAALREAYLSTEENL